MSGQAYAVPANKSIYVKGRIKNPGVASWAAGTVQFGVNENFGAKFRRAIPEPVPRLGELKVPKRLLSNGISTDTPYQFQMIAENRTWSDGSIKIMLIPLA